MRYIGLFGLGMGLAVFGCAAAPSEQVAATEAGEPGETETFVETDTPAIVSIDIDAEHRVSFHEVGDVMIVAERAQNGVPSVLDEPHLAQASAIEVYEALRPGQKAPAELVAALERLREARSQARLDELTFEPAFGGGASALASLASPAPAGVGQHTEALSESYFRNDLGGCFVPSWADPVFQVCVPNWGNGFFAYAKSKIAYWVVASQSGSFQVKVNASTGGHGSGIFTVNHNTYQRLVAKGEYCCSICPCDIHPRTLRIDIIEATGDTFHVGGYWAGR